MDSAVLRADPPVPNPVSAAVQAPEFLVVPALHPPPNPEAVAVRGPNFENITPIQSEHQSLIPIRMRRESIAYVFTHILRAPAENEWKDRDGTISYIQNLLQIPQGSCNTIQKVLHNVVYCSVADVPYDSSIDGRINLGNSSAIKDGSIELQILADALEAGKSMDEATLLVNEHRFEDGSQPVGRSAVYARSLSLEPNVSMIGTQSQGNRDVNSNYGKARYNYVRHLLVRFGHKPAHDADLPDPFPDWLDAEKLAAGGFMLSINQIGFWDETHQ